MKVLPSILFFFLCNGTMAQHSGENRHGLKVIRTQQEYKKNIGRQKEFEMLDIKAFIRHLVFEPRYAGVNNFTHTRLYPPINTTFLRRNAAQKLKVVQQELNRNGLGLKIFDAYRPYSVTERMWELVQDERYAANPEKGSSHNRGVAVDLTIINLKTKKELNMGTDFDNFTDSAHHDFTALAAEVLQNRCLLKNLMEKHGFVALETEWWHYALPNASQYALLDLSFEEMKDLAKARN